MKRILIICLLLTLLFTFSGCGEKEEPKKDDIKQEDVTKEDAKEENSPSEKEDAKTSNSIVGDWVVEKNEVYEGPMKATAEKAMEVIYYVGAEFTYHEDGTFTSVDFKNVEMKYNILSDNQMEWINVTTGQTDVNDYELNGDNLVVYCHYTGDYASAGYAGAIYFTRK